MIRVLKYLFFLLVLVLSIGLVSCNKDKPPDDQPDNPDDTIGSKPPTILGKLVYHTYSCYSCNDSKLYYLDFATKELVCLSTNWEIDNPMNVHFSPDGKNIVFMGTSSGTANWDVFLYKTGSSLSPVNLTVESVGRDEDPKFSPDGSKIVFKRNGILTEMDTTGLVLKEYELPQTEASMPYYTSDSDNILYAAKGDDGTNLDIFLVSCLDGNSRILSSTTNVEDYYPIVRNDTSFLFTRWYAPDNMNDQVYLGFYDDRTSVRLPFNEVYANCSDAFPVDGRNLVLSSTKKGGRGGYDLYVADIKTGKTWSINVYNPYINTSDNELGACYLNK
ncbi:MAG: TolB family protein [Bacteroidales bacterium]|jgi:Tol biopolymer transport system component